MGKINGWRLAFLIFLGVYAAYLCWRIYAIAPWFDETFTYREFIDRGIWYSMTHWPLPTNHVFYCVLSGLANLFGNTYIGLRGVSYISALMILILLFYCLEKRCSGAIALAGCIVYANFWLVMDQAVQGRGYTLSNLLLLTGICCVDRIFVLRDKGYPVRKSLFFGYSIAMFLALYTVPTNFFWIAAFVLSIFFMCCRRKDRILLWRFMKYGIGSAVMTVCSDDYSAYGCMEKNQQDLCVEKKKFFRKGIVEKKRTDFTDMLRGAVSGTLSVRKREL